MTELFRPGRPKKTNPLTPAEKQARYRAKQKQKSLQHIDYAVYCDVMDTMIKEREAFYYAASAEDKDARMNETNVLVAFDIRFKHYLKTALKN